MKTFVNEEINFIDFDKTDFAQKYNIVYHTSRPLYLEIILNKFISIEVDGGFGYTLLELSHDNIVGHTHQCSINHIRKYYKKTEITLKLEYELLERCLSNIKFRKNREDILTKIKLGLIC